MRDNVLCARDEKKVRKALSRENRQLNDFYYSLYYETLCARVSLITKH